MILIDFNLIFTRIFYMDGCLCSLAWVFVHSVLSYLFVWCVMHLFFSPRFIPTRPSHRKYRYIIVYRREKKCVDVFARDYVFFSFLCCSLLFGISLSMKTLIYHSTGCTNSFATFFVLHVSLFRSVAERWFFSKDAPSNSVQTSICLNLKQ